MNIVNTNMYVHNSVAIFPLKTYTLAGFELGSFVPQADVMTTAPTIIL
jgi:hypothetical protein